MFNLALLLQRTNQYAEAANYWRRYLASKQPTPKYPTDLVLDFLEGGNSDANFGRGVAGSHACN